MRERLSFCTAGFLGGALIGLALFGSLPEANASPVASALLFLVRLEIGFSIFRSQTILEAQTAFTHLGCDWQPRASSALLRVGTQTRCPEE
jgi:hypothetical protein